MAFRIPVYDLHKNIEFDELGNSYFVPIKDNSDDEPWKKFSVSLDLTEVKVQYTFETVIFQTADVPIKCLKVYLDEGSMFFCTLSEETFWKRYDEELKRINPE